MQSIRFANPRRITEQNGRTPQIAENKTVSAFFFLYASYRGGNRHLCGEFSGYLQNIHSPADYHGLQYAEQTFQRLDTTLIN